MLSTIFAHNHYKLKSHGIDRTTIGGKVIAPTYYKHFINIKEFENTMLELFHIHPKQNYECWKRFVRKGGGL